MNSISVILKNIKNLLPYFLLIAIYFFFVNLEARKTDKIIRNSEEKKVLTDDKSSIYEEKMRIKIPVIPYKQ